MKCSATVLGLFLLLGGAACNGGDNSRSPPLVAVLRDRIVGFSPDDGTPGKSMQTLSDKGRVNLVTSRDGQIFTLQAVDSKYEVTVFQDVGQLSGKPRLRVSTGFEPPRDIPMGFAYSDRRDAALVLSRNSESKGYDLHVRALGAALQRTGGTTAPTNQSAVRDVFAPEGGPTEVSRALSTPSGKNLSNLAYDDSRDVLYSIAAREYRPSLFPTQDDPFVLAVIRGATTETADVKTLSIAGLSKYRSISALATYEAKDRLYLIADGALLAVNNASGNAPTLAEVDAALGQTIDAQAGPETPRNGSRFFATTMAVDAIKRRLWVGSFGTIAGIAIDGSHETSIVLSTPSMVSSVVVFAPGSAQ